MIWIIWIFNYAFCCKLGKTSQIRVFRGVSTQNITILHRGGELLKFITILRNMDSPSFDQAGNLERDIVTHSNKKA